MEPFTQERRTGVRRNGDSWSSDSTWTFHGLEANSEVDKQLERKVESGESRNLCVLGCKHGHFLTALGQAPWLGRAVGACKATSWLTVNLLAVSPPGRRSSGSLGPFHHEIPPQNLATSYWGSGFQHEFGKNTNILFLTGQVFPGRYKGI